MLLEIFIEIESYLEDGKFIENETGVEFSKEEAIEVVQEYWRDMATDYFSWDLKKVYFNYDNSYEDDLDE